MELIWSGSQVRRLAAAVLVVGLAVTAVTLARSEAPAEAGSQQVRVLGTGYLRQDASVGGTAAMLLSLGGGSLQHRAVCLDLSGGVHRLRIMVRSEKVGGRAFTRNGSVGPDGTWRELWIAEGPGSFGVHETHEVLYKDGTARLFDVTFAVNHGRDCTSRIVATTV